jgi:hypothetical protein
MSAFNKMLTKTRDRNWGGTSSNVACEPYISGFSYVKWLMPKTLHDYIAANAFIFKTNDQTTLYGNKYDNEVLESSCVSVTPPGGTLNTVEYQGLGGTKWGVPGGIDYGNTISLKYIEFSGLPILRIHRAWVNMIRDNKIGLTALKGSTQASQIAGGAEYNKANYSATLLYWTTKPDGCTVEYYAAYSGVYPTKDPLDLFTGDITAIDKLEIDIDYHLDFIWHEDWVYSLACKEATKAKQGSTGNTLWSRDGFRYMEQNAAEFINTPAVL